MTDFSALNLSSPLAQAVEALGYTQATAIQAQSLPVMLAGRDIVAQAKTGSGKTAAFGLAVLAALDTELGEPQALVLCPTRELADQVAKELRDLARFIPNIKILTLCGGVPLRPQLASLRHLPHIVVGTPGRIQDLLRREALPMERIASVVLDEADRMLDMGFVEVISDILSRTPKNRRTWMFSATYPEEIRFLSKQFQREPETVTVESSHSATVIEQRYYRAEPAQKTAAILALLGEQQPDACLIFCNTRNDVRDLTTVLCDSGVSAIALHGEMDQRDRDETLVQFANASARVLVATDVAARGLDIKALPMVLAYELPTDPDVHTHRIGRTARAGETGLVCCLVSGREQGRMPAIEALLDAPVRWSELPLSSGRRIPAANMQTLVMDAGRQDKLRPGDILGALTGDGGLTGDQVGKIDIFPTRSYVAIQRSKLAATLKKLQQSKIKGKRIRVRCL